MLTAGYHSPGSIKNGLIHQMELILRKEYDILTTFTRRLMIFLSKR